MKISALFSSKDVQSKFDDILCQREVIDDKNRHKIFLVFIISIYYITKFCTKLTLGFVNTRIFEKMQCNHFSKNG